VSGGETTVSLARGRVERAVKTIAYGTPVLPDGPKVLGASLFADYGIRAQAHGCIGHPAFRAPS
jgi:hypothetical protein